LYAVEPGSGGRWGSRRQKPISRLSPDPPPVEKAPPARCRVSAASPRPRADGLLLAQQYFPALGLDSMCPPVPNSDPWDRGLASTDTGSGGCFAISTPIAKQPPLALAEPMQQQHPLCTSSSTTPGPIPPRRSGSVPWHQGGRRTRILTCTICSRRPAARETTPPRCPGQSNHRPPAPNPTLNSLVRQGVFKNTGGGGCSAISPPIAPPPPPCPPLGLLPEPLRARVTGVSSAHHEEVGGHLASPSSSPGSTGPGPRGRCQKAPPLLITVIRSRHMVASIGVVNTWF
jgi:hypothetical protein